MAIIIIFILATTSPLWIEPVFALILLIGLGIDVYIKAFFDFILKLVGKK